MMRAVLIAAALVCASVATSGAGNIKSKAGGTSLTLDPSVKPASGGGFQPAKMTPHKGVRPASANPSQSSRGR